MKRAAGPQGLSTLENSEAAPYSFSGPSSSGMSKLGISGNALPAIAQAPQANSPACVRAWAARSIDMRRALLPSIPGFRVRIFQGRSLQGLTSNKYLEWLQRLNNGHRCKDPRMYGLC
jgi:hypothetical protein